jgi:hypothetical protein
MKTAVSFILARIEMLYIEKDSIHWEMFKNDCIEKEKEQIIDAHIEGQRVFDNYPHTQWTNDQAEEYYNQTYNQDKQDI